MHERIRLISDTNVGVQRNDSPCAITFYDLKSGIHSREGDVYESWDDAGLEADALVNACYRQTHSFAALADTSGVPVIGAVRRVAGDDGQWTVLAKQPNQSECDWLVSTGDTHRWISESKFLPLVASPPARKYRRWTPADAVAHLGKKIRSKNCTMPEFSIDAICDVHIHCWSYRHIPYDELLEQYELTSGEPCGIIEAYEPLAKGVRV